MTLSPAVLSSVVVLILVLVELLVIKELTASGRQSEGLRVPVQTQERLPKGRRYLYRPDRWTGR